MASSRFIPPNFSHSITSPWNRTEHIRSLEKFPVLHLQFFLFHNSPPKEILVLFSRKCSCSVAPSPNKTENLGRCKIGWGVENIPCENSSPNWIWCNNPCAEQKLFKGSLPVSFCSSSLFFPICWSRILQGETKPELLAKVSIRETAKQFSKSFSPSGGKYSWKSEGARVRTDTLQEGDVCFWCDDYRQNEG